MFVWKHIYLLHFHYFTIYYAFGSSAFLFPLPFYVSRSLLLFTCRMPISSIVKSNRNILKAIQWWSSLNCCLAIQCIEFCPKLFRNNSLAHQTKCIGIFFLRFILSISMTILARWQSRFECDFVAIAINGWHYFRVMHFLRQIKWR